MTLKSWGVSIWNALKGDISTLGSPSQWLADYFGGQTSASGVQINEGNALQVSDVYKCVRVLSESVAMLPLKVYERLEPRGKKLAVDHPLYSILHDEPNDNMTAFVLKETLMGHVLITGNMYAYIERNRGGRIVALWPLVPHLVKMCSVDGSVYYEVRTANGQASTFQADEILHVPGLGYDGIKGYSPIALHMQALGLAKATEIYGATFFGNGARPSGVLTHPQALKKEAYERLKESWNAQHQGAASAHKVSILEEGVTYTTISVPPEEAQFLQSRQYSRSEIAGLFRVPPHKIGDLSRSTNNNIEQQALEFVGDALTPWLEKFEQECFRKLLTPTEKKKYFIEFEMKALLRGDTAARTAHYKDMWQTSVYSANEIREFENLNPIDGGDVYYVPLNYIPADMARQINAPAPDAAPPSPDTSAKFIERFRGAYKGIFRDAVGRIINKNGAARSKYASPIIMPVLQALSEGINGAVSAENQVFLDEFASALAIRAALWTAEKADEIAESELERAISALSERGVAA